MQRTKQQALMFVLGAALVGGAVGFSAAGYIGHEKFASQYGPRSRFFDELGLTTQQRATLDSLSSAQECALKAALAPHDSVLKSISRTFRAQVRQVFTPEQLAKYDARHKEIQTRRDAERQKEPKRACSQN